MSDVVHAASTTEAPREDEDSAVFWDAVRRHCLVLQVCAQCDTARFPPLPACPSCGALESAWKDAPDRGRIYSWIRVHRTLNGSFAPEVPYIIATIDLAPGCRMFARLEHTDDPSIGQSVSPVYRDHEGWTEVRFVPAEPREPDAGPVQS